MNGKTKRGKRRGKVQTVDELRVRVRKRGITLFEVTYDGEIRAQPSFDLRRQYKATAPYTLRHIADGDEFELRERLCLRVFDDRELTLRSASNDGALVLIPDDRRVGDGYRTVCTGSFVRRISDTTNVVVRLVGLISAPTKTRK